MNQKTTICILFALLAAPLAWADFVETNSSENGRQINIDVADATTISAETTRKFTIDNVNATPVFVTLSANDGESLWLDNASYSIDLFLSVDNGTTYTQVGTDVNTTDASTPVSMTSASSPMFKAIMKFPATRDTGYVPASFIITIDEAAATNGTGAVQNPGLRHDATLYFYDAASDSDADGLPDAWEMQHFDTLEYNGGDDPDGDGYSNEQERAAGSDPDNEASIPAEPVFGGGGGNVNDRELGVTMAGLVVFALIFFLGVLVAVDRAKKGMDERKVALVTGIMAATTLIGFLLVFVFDAIDLGGQGWAFWAYLNVTWQEWTVFALGAFVVLAAGGLALMRTPQRQEKKVVAQAAIAGVVVTALSVVLFVIVDLPVPFLG